MKITFDKDALDTDTINSVPDLLKFLDDIPEQTVSIFAKDRDYPSKMKELLFDECTPKETAIRNLLYVLTVEEKKLRSKLFPADVANLALLAKQSGKDDLINLPPVDTEAYADYQKVGYIKSFATRYLEFSLQSRIGFGLNLSVRNNGQIYCLRDLRELHTSTV